MSSFNKIHNFVTKNSEADKYKNAKETYQRLNTGHVHIGKKIKLLQHDTTRQSKLVPTYPEFEVHLESSVKLDNRK